MNGQLLGKLRSKERPAWELIEGDSPIVASAIHCGHELRGELVPSLALSDAARLREEDPYTERWTDVGDTRIIVRRSRFEVDLNRPRSKAVYVKPEDAWGLEIWKHPPTLEMIEHSLAEYDAFYAEMHRVFSNLERRFGHFFVYDLHAYNYRREGPEEPAADPAANPEVNISTSTLVRSRWASVVDRLEADLRAFDYQGRHLDVRENVKFRDGYFIQWIQENFPYSGCALEIEFEKFFMDEWTGEVDPEQLDAIGCALRSTVPGVLEELGKLPVRPR